MPKLTLEEKRREVLRRQLYGKEVSVVSSKQSAVSRSKHDHSAETFSYSEEKTPSTNSLLLTTNYLTSDLTRILIFSTLAIAIQISLYFLMQNNLVKLPF